MRAGRASRMQLVVAIALLLVLHFYVRPRLWDSRVAPDFLMLALVLVAGRVSPGAGAVAGFAAGLAVDALAPAHFGAGALAHTIVGYLAAWSRALFFAENLLVYAAVAAVGVLLRDGLVLVAGGGGAAAVGAEFGLNAPLQALTTALAGATLLYGFREWFAIRLDA